MESSERLSRFLRERRHRGPPQRVFFLRQGFFLEEECCRAFRNLGLTVQEFQLGENWNGDPPSRLLTGLVDFLPDFLFCINHLGFDQKGWLTGFLKDACLPVGIWYADHPDLIMRASPANVSEWVAVFVWDRQYVAGLQEMGFPWVTYLPLAADTQLFRPYRHPPVDRFGCHDAAFVGDTWTQRVNQHMARYAGQPATLAYIESAALNFQWSNHYQADADLAEVFPGFAQLPLGEQVNLEAAVLWRVPQLSPGTAALLPMHRGEPEFHQSADEKRAQPEGFRCARVRGLFADGLQGGSVGGLFPGGSGDFRQRRGSPGEGGLLFEVS